jgi:hypothetical protein
MRRAFLLTETQTEFRSYGAIAMIGIQMAPLCSLTMRRMKQTLTSTRPSSPPLERERRGRTLDGSEGQSAKFVSARSHPLPLPHAGEGDYVKK